MKYGQWSDGLARRVVWAKNPDNIYRAVHKAFLPLMIQKWTRMNTRTHALYQRQSARGIYMGLCFSKEFKVYFSPIIVYVYLKCIRQLHEYINHVGGLRRSSCCCCLHRYARSPNAVDTSRVPSIDSALNRGGPLLILHRLYMPYMAVA